jgi:thiosulfate reductase/polysulfide reductase chain A
MELYSENDIWINEQSGKDMGLKTGDYVRMSNQQGKKATFKVKVRLTQRVRPDVVWLVHGWGHTNPNLKAGYGKGASDTEMLTHTVIDPVMGSVGTQHNFVTFTKEA